jgi:hypothetical protein
MSDARALAASDVGRELVLGGFTSTDALLFLEILLVGIRRLTFALEVIRVVLLLKLAKVRNLYLMKKYLQYHPNACMRHP